MSGATPALLLLAIASCTSTSVAVTKTVTKSLTLRTGSPPHVQLQPSSQVVADDLEDVAMLQRKASYPAVLTVLREVAEYMKEMGTTPQNLRKRSALRAVLLEDSETSQAPAGDAGHVVVENNGNFSAATASQYSIALVGVLVFLVGALCSAAPAKKADPSAESTLETFRLMFYILSWMALSAGLTIFNKWMFVPSGANFPHVATLTWCHMLASTVLTRVIQFLQPGLFPAVSQGDMSKWEILRLVIPVACLQPFTLVLGNTAYLYLSVSYIQMIKAAMPGMVFIISTIVGLEKFSMEETFMLVVLGLGVAGCSHGELSFSWIGLGYQLASFLCEALRIICLKFLVSSGKSLDPLSALFYVAPVNLLALAGPMLYEMKHIPIIKIYELRYVLGANCLTAFGLNVAGVCLMSMASAVTFTVCGLLKDFGLIIGSTLIFGNVLTIEESLGAVVVLSSAAVFQRYQKTKNMKK